MTISDDEFGSQPPSDIEAVAASPQLSEDEAERARILGGWITQFRRLHHRAKAKWMATHDMTLERAGGLTEAIYLEPNGAKWSPDDYVPCQMDAELEKAGLDRVDFGGDPCLPWDDFVKYSEMVRRQLARAADQRRGWGIQEVANLAKDMDRSSLLIGAIPKNQITMFFGRYKSTKSTFGHTLAICSAMGLPFYGEPVRKGRSLYLTVDPGATKWEVVPRLQVICERLKTDLPDKDQFELIEGGCYLNDPKSVDLFLRDHPGAFETVFIDSLYMAVRGGLSNETVMTEAFKGMRDIAAATGAQVIVNTHEGKDGKGVPYGSVFQLAGLSSLIHFHRSLKNVVTATVDPQVMKNSPARKEPWRFQLVDAVPGKPEGEGGPFLDSLDAPTPTPRALSSAGAAPVPVPVNVPHRDKVALIPTKATSKQVVRKLIEDGVLTGEQAARDKQWQRLRTAWEEAGLIGQSGSMMWRLVP